MWDFKTFPLQIRFHAAIPNWAKLVGLKIRTVHECEGGGFMIDIEQAKGIMDALYKQYKSPEIRYLKLPKPTQYTVVEGGHWFNWNYSNNFKIAHAIKLEDGSIFDMVNGWRPNKKYGCNLCKDTQRVWDGEFHIKCPKCAQQNQSQKANSSLTAMEELASMGYKKSDDIRVVPRGLLEHCLETLEYWQRHYFGPEKITTDINVAINQLKAALAIEKKELKASIVHSRSCPVILTGRSECDCGAEIARNTKDT